MADLSPPTTHEVIRSTDTLSVPMSLGKAKPKTPVMKNLTENDIRDIAIRITEKLVELGYVPDCTDTDNGQEFEVQDLIEETITNSLKV